MDEGGALALSSKFMRTCHKINIIAQTTGADASSFYGESEIPNKIGIIPQEILY